METRLGTSVPNVVMDSIITNKLNEAEHCHGVRLLAVTLTQVFPQNISHYCLYRGCKLD